MAMVSPGRTWRSMSLSTSTSGTYWKWTCSKVTSPRMSGSSTASGASTISGWVSSTSKMRWPPAIARWRWGDWGARARVGGGDEGAGGVEESLDVEGEGEDDADAEGAVEDAHAAEDDDEGGGGGDQQLHQGHKGGGRQAGLHVGAPVVRVHLVDAEGCVPLPG